MKKITRKLSIAKESVRVLTPREMTRAGGGMPWSGWYCYTATSYNCTDGHAGCDLKQP